VPKGKALELLPTKHVSLANDTVNVDDVVGFLSCMTANMVEAEVPKMLGVSIGLKRCRTECKVEPERDQMQANTSTNANTKTIIPRTR